VIAGPTASGKTAFAHRLAEKGGNCILSADAMQRYRALPILSAAPTVHELARFHYIGVGDLDAWQRGSAGDFARLAHKVATERRDAGEPPPILCGGTGFYLRAALEGLIDEEDHDPAQRAERASELDATPLAELVARLRRDDPDAAARIDLNNPARVRRALLVQALTQRPMSAWWREDAARRASTPPPLTLVRRFVVTRPREELHARIDRRARAMLAGGVVEEAARLGDEARARGVDPRAWPVVRTLGVEVLLDALDAGRVQRDACMNSALMDVENARLPPPWRALAEAIALTTRQYAKRQLTWLRKYAPPSDTTEWIESREA